MSQDGRVVIIAEAGVNHNGDIAIAKKMITAAKNAGADFIKFQTGHKVISKFAPKAEYQKVTTGSDESQLDMVNRLMLKDDEFIELNYICTREDIAFLSTPFDLDAIELLSSFDMPFWKIPSGEVTNLPYLIRIASTHKPIVMSTGMCEIDEIGAALDVLKKHGGGAVTLLHCTTEYPAPYQEVNLRAMQRLGEIFNVPVGYSDHTPGIEVPIAAAALGATVIEKHFTLDKNMEGPDHKASLEPNELAAMVSAIRHIEAALGDGNKTCTKAEAKNRDIARKSIVASRDIRAGEVFTEDNVATKRPGNGISPMRWFEVIGQSAKRDFAEDELIEL